MTDRSSAVPLGMLNIYPEYDWPSKNVPNVLDEHVWPPPGAAPPRLLTCIPTPSPRGTMRSAPHPLVATCPSCPLLRLCPASLASPCADTCVLWGGDGAWAATA
eukprot:gene5540-5521_t